MRNNKTASLFPKELVIESLKQSFVKLNPRMMFRNPIMFIVEVVTFVMLFVTIWAAATGDTTQGSFGYNILVFIVLFATLLFANFAEAIAEARGKAQADSLRKTREETPAKLCVGNKIETVSSSQLKKGDIFICEAGDTIPSDGEIIEGLASIDESAITGESAPVIREAGGDKSSVTGGTKVLSDQIKVKVTTEPGESFLDKMIALVEGASRQKTPNEIALTILLAGFTLVFVVVCGTLKPFADYSNTTITIAAFISLFVCLIPTTIGGLLSAIGIAGMDRALSANVITKSGKAVETAGDIDTLLLDKTGTITIGNRKATQFYPVSGIDEHSFVQACLLSSLSDDTPEGKSIVELGREKGVRVHDLNTSGSKMIKFTAETKCSGVDLANGTRIRKGAFDAIRKMSEAAGNKYPKEVADLVQKITSNGGTPLVVSQDEIEQVQESYVNQYGFQKISRIVAGGKERYHSVACGLQAVHQDCDFVFIHDSARPMLTQEILQRAYRAVQEEEACVVGVPSKDTVKIADEQGYVSVTPNRSLVWNVQTPQVFSYPLVHSAYEELLQKEQELLASGVQITDDAMVVEHLARHKVKLVEGSYENIKITTPEDVQIAERYLQSR